MPELQFTEDDLKRILYAAAGTEEEGVADGDFSDTEFQVLGYESLALLETCGRIEREYGVALADHTLAEAVTPRLLVEAVNRYLGEQAVAATR
ncbi:act minimal PKS acyl carrier protein [Streptomyces puniciscabiei]|uniref:Act minimal PKS acyl carrier protein n=1 Tax=Streptomyces puniciscabiei TaxID=164348 RepID=A0A542SXE4_9ACTN|nr:acyl carrier protein [Streptomyces puniciscabiei]TQK79286.1 act minimal PKS acyl carrier protein [Streptomyces puniciscabiei]